MHQFNFRADGDVLVVPDDFKFDHCSRGLGYPGQYFRLWSLIRYYSSQILKATDSLQFLVVYGNVSGCLVVCGNCFLLSMVIVINWIFSALICMLYAVEVSSRWFTNLTSSCSCPARPSMLSAKRKFVIVLPLILTVPSRSSSASAIIFSKKMLKRVGESRHPWRTWIVIWNHSPMLFSW